MVTELAENGCLDSFLSYFRKQDINAKLDPFAVVSLFLQSCFSVDFIHNRAEVRVIHKDLNPSNMLISEDGIVKMCDFGASTNRNFTNIIPIRHGYQPPEFNLINDEQKPNLTLLDNKIDIYCLGVLLFHLATND